ncbi:SSU ribosomal protein S16p [hydrothermal vent metagenome]|uniref:SSU ribosomal protein S16p n=1 Tax=hydrothermal vent metagenome TaxID=652676 RepID=A0A3B0T7G3_9ZZZZ
MPVKIRLQRHGKKGKPFYWVVAADSRTKRDGKFLEKLGIYDPNTNPAIIEVKIDNAVKWLQNGAQPTDTARAILSYKGVMLKHHLLGGLRKGALTEEQVEEKFNAWIEEKEKSVAVKVGGLEKVKADAKAKALAAEKEVSEKRALAAVEAELPEAEAATETPEGEAVEAKVEETATEEVAETVTETKEVEKVEEAPKEETPAKEEVAEAASEAEVAEKAEEAPKEEAKADSEDKASNEEK